ncbi:hypothetical protein FHY52_31750 [Nocardia nova]|nr:hypothetical protein [Nocardia nova]
MSVISPAYPDRANTYLCVAIAAVGRRPRHRPTAQTSGLSAPEPSTRHHFPASGAMLIVIVAAIVLVFVAVAIALIVSLARRVRSLTETLSSSIEFAVFLPSGSGTRAHIAMARAGGRARDVGRTEGIRRRAGDSGTRRPARPRADRGSRPGRAMWGGLLSRAWIPPVRHASPHACVTTRFGWDDLTENLLAQHHRRNRSAPSVRSVPTVAAVSMPAVRACCDYRPVRRDDPSYASHRCTPLCGTELRVSVAVDE